MFSSGLQSYVSRFAAVGAIHFRNAAHSIGDIGDVGADVGALGIYGGLARECVNTL